MEIIQKKKEIIQHPNISRVYRVCSNMFWSVKKKKIFVPDTVLYILMI